MESSIIQSILNWEAEDETDMCMFFCFPEDVDEIKAEFASLYKIEVIPAGIYSKVTLIKGRFILSE